MGLGAGEGPSRLDSFQFGFGIVDRSHSVSATARLKNKKNNNKKNLLRLLAETHSRNSL